MSVVRQEICRSIRRGSDVWEILTKQRCHAQDPSQETSPIKTISIPVRTSTVTHIHIANVILTSSNEKIIRDDNAGHWAEEDAPATKHSNKRSRIGHIVPRTNRYGDHCENVASSPDVDPLRTKGRHVHPRRDSVQHLAQGKLVD